MRIQNSQIAAKWATTYTYGLNNSSSSRTFVQSSQVEGISNAGGRWAIFNTSSGQQVFIDGVEIGGKVRNDSGSNNIWVSSSKFLSGAGSIEGPGTVTCAGVITQAYTFYASACP